MKIKCWVCGEEFELKNIYHDELQPGGFFAYCPHHDGSLDIDFDMSKLFITDVEKMTDFGELTKEEFLRSYSYLTEEEYDMTELYLIWLWSIAEENLKNA